MDLKTGKRGTICWVRSYHTYYMYEYRHGSVGSGVLVLVGGGFYDAWDTILQGSMATVSTNSDHVLSPGKPARRARKIITVTVYNTQDGTPPRTSFQDYILRGRRECKCRRCASICLSKYISEIFPNPPCSSCAPTSLALEKIGSTLYLRVVYGKACVLIIVYL